LAVFLLDQVTKYIVKTSMYLHQSISFPLFGDFFRLTYIENPGMAFGISFGENTFFTVFAIIASIAILIYMFKMKGDQFYPRLAMAIIFGGALGNLTDRVLRGSVVDFLDCDFFNINIPKFDLLFLHFPGYGMNRWPVYNVADMAVTIGMVLLLIFVIFEEEQETKENTLLEDSETGMVR